MFGSVELYKTKHECSTNKIVQSLPIALISLIGILYWNIFTYLPSHFSLGLVKLHQEPFYLRQDQVGLDVIMSLYLGSEFECLAIIVF